ARDRVRNIDQRLEQLEGQASSLAQAEAWVRDTHALLDRARAAVEPSGELHARARLEMIDSMRRLGRPLDDGLARHRAVLHARRTSAPHAQAGPGQAPAAAAAPAEATPDRQRAQNRVDDLAPLMRQFKSNEATMFTRGFSHVPPTQGGTWAPWNRFLVQTPYIEAHEVGREIADFHELWINRIQELRHWYEIAGTAQDRWLVSRGPGQPRNAQTEPDMERL